jgi:NitT/TauT family transport system ATP-binding protein
MNAVELSSTTFAYPRSRPVFLDLDIAIPDKSYCCIVGQSGSGKTTLLRLIAGLEAPNKGRISMPATRPNEGVVQLVFQDYSRSLLPWISASHNVSLGFKARPRHTNGKADAHELLQLMGLSHVDDLLPSQLSGGMQQRVAIARALAAEPTVLLLDEPFGALDTLTKLDLQDEIMRLWKSKSLTIVHVTHDLDEACFLSDQIVLLKDERRATIIQNDVPRPRHRLVSREDPRFLALRRRLFEELGYA